VKKLAGMRVMAGLSQKQVAGELGVHQTAISHWERGVGLMRADKVSVLAKLYGVTEKEILDTCKSNSTNRSLIDHDTPSPDG
jgi:transcriptional regulator with XRE-family HTH domain